CLGVSPSVTCPAASWRSAFGVTCQAFGLLVSAFTVHEKSPLARSFLPQFTATVAPGPLARRAGALPARRLCADAHELRISFHLHAHGMRPGHLHRRLGGGAPEGPAWRPHRGGSGGRRPRTHPPARARRSPRPQ